MAERSSCSDGHELANEFGKSSPPKLVFNRFDYCRLSAKPGDEASTESKGSANM